MKLPKSENIQAWKSQLLLPEEQEEGAITPARPYALLGAPYRDGALHL